MEPRRSYEDLKKSERDNGMDTALVIGYSHSYFGHSLSGAWLYINIKNDEEVKMSGRSNRSMDRERPG